MKTLCLYVFHICNERVKHFIENAVFFDKSVDFLFICNNITIKREDLNLPDYCKFITRENIGFDFGGWSEGLLTNNLYKDYTHFIFANSSIIGPFLPPNFEGKWVDIYLNGLKNNIKLFGSTINSLNDPLHKSHIQTYIFSMDLETLEYLIDCGIFNLSKYAETFIDCIQIYEIGMSRKIIEKGWNIGCLMNYYKDVDFTFKSKKPFEYSYFLCDVMYPQYKNIFWNENEIVFYKANRDIFKTNKNTNILY